MLFLCERLLNGFKLYSALVWQFSLSNIYNIFVQKSFVLI